MRDPHRLIELESEHWCCFTRYAVAICSRFCETFHRAKACVPHCHAGNAVLPSAVSSHATSKEPVRASLRREAKDHTSVTYRSTLKRYTRMATPSKTYLGSSTHFHRSSNVTCGVRALPRPVVKQWPQIRRTLCTHNTLGRVPSSLSRYR